MTEVNETALLAMLVEDPEHDPATCCFCQKGEPTERTNVFECTSNEDDQAHLDPLTWVTFKNDAHTLGSNIGRELLPAEGYWVVATATQAFRPVAASERGAHAVGVAAHHLIPGNAALARSRLYRQNYLGQPGTGTNQIGYDINRAENGVWTPGNYAIRPWGPQAVAFHEAYAEAAIATVQAQFHDAHPQYSERVLAALELIADKVDHQQQICPFSADQDPASRVLITLVASLDGVSRRCRRLLTFPTSGWKKTMFLSRFSLIFMNKHHLGGP